jgi:hypothetical protein
VRSSRAGGHPRTPHVTSGRRTACRLRCGPAGPRRAARGPQADVRIKALGGRADVVPQLVGCSEECSRHTVAAHQLASEQSIPCHVVEVTLAIVGDLRERRDPRAGASLDRRGEADVVVVVVRADHELDVLYADPTRAQSALECIQGLVAGRARVDEGKWVAAQQPRVDRADAGERDGNCLDGRHRRNHKPNPLQYYTTAQDRARSSTTRRIVGGPQKPANNGVSGGSAQRACTPRLRCYDLNSV